MGMWEGFLRWRHSKGFGVHSPYAYQFVTNVLRPGPYSFYSFQEIDRHLSPSERRNYEFENLIKFTIRFANFLHTKRIMGNPDSSRLIEVTAKAMGISWKTIKGNKTPDIKEGDFIIIEKQISSENLVQHAISNQIAIFVINPNEELRKELETPLERGLLLKDKKNIILIPRSEMTYVSYDMKLDPMHRMH